MNMSFYVGALGAKAGMDRMSVSANNLANVNNNGFKPKNAVFTDMLNYNLNAAEGEVSKLKAGNGVRTQRTYTDFSSSGITETGQEHDYAILQDNAFFMLKDPGTEAISFTRDGHFHIGRLGEEGDYYLLSDNGKYVMDEEGEPLVIEVVDIEKMIEEANSEDGEADDDDDEDDEEDKPTVGVYTLSNPSHLSSIGDNEYVTTREMEAVAIENPRLRQGALEISGTNVAREMVRVIESQRAYTYALKMVQTSDEIEGTVNSLRG